MLLIRNLRKAYPDFQLSIERFCVRPATVVGLVGANGAGKTTFIRCIANFIRDYEGEVLIEGERYTGVERHLVSKLSYMSEEVDLIAALTVADHLELAKALSPRWSDSVAATLAREWDLDLHKPVGKLSRGNRVKVGMLTALSRQPRLLVLDEPTSGLDPVIRVQILRQLRKLRAEGRSALISSHIIEDIEQLADEIAIMKTGSIAEIMEHVGTGHTLREDVLKRLTDRT